MENVQYTVKCHKCLPTYLYEPIVRCTADGPSFKRLVTYVGLAKQFQVDWARECPRPCAKVHSLLLGLMHADLRTI